MTPKQLFVPLLTMCAAAALQGADSLPDPASLPPIPGYPDLLVAADGSRIATKDQWAARAAELKKMVQFYEYGYLPPKPGADENGGQSRANAVVAEQLFADPNAVGGKATLRELKLTWGRTDMSITLLVATPNKVKRAPVFLGLNFTGNHTVVAEPKVKLPEVWMRPVGGQNKARDEDRGSAVDTWCIEQVIDRGYAVATFFNGDVVPDEPKLAEEALAKLRGKPGDRGPTDAGTIAAWAWCLHRAVDYLVTDAAIDPKRIALVGHSRNGKTALLATAFDERVAMVIPSQAGAGGTSPVRIAPELAAIQPNGRPKAESVAVINKSFPHWFNGNFKQFNETPDKLPYDHHAMIALCAPRPVLLSNATEDIWANPSGQFAMLVAADPVYQLVAGEGVKARTMPEIGALMEGRLGYFIRPGKHSMNKTDWDAWLTYADKWLR